MRILLAIHGSKLSEAATQAVIETAKPLKTEVQIIYVIDMLTNQLPEMTAYYPGIEQTERAAETCGGASRKNGGIAPLERSFGHHSRRVGKS